MLYGWREKTAWSINGYGNPQAVFIFITRPSYEENSMPGDGKDEPAAKGYKEVGSGG